ncbi:hypothetical protein, partial [uncultured Desulfovibrio sp.]|uniref:hypothetical protein n=1 Tax=uncultured Desulfovibrio sp. TaxID=167968 RepID=UPI0026152D2F
TGFSPGLKTGYGSGHSPEAKPRGAARLQQGALQGLIPDGERVPSFEALARHCDPIRETCGVIPGRYPDRMYRFMGFGLVTTLSRRRPPCGPLRGYIGDDLTSRWVNKS